jgi:hypothetical protein
MEKLMLGLFASPREVRSPRDLPKHARGDELSALLAEARQPRMQTSVVKGPEPRTSGGGTLRAVGSGADVEAQQPLLAAKASPAGTPPASTGGAPPGAHHGGHHGGPPQWALTVAYGLTNLLSVVMIVVANKMVLFTLKFHFVVTLTLLHSIFTAVGMGAMAAAGLFQVKAISPRHSIPIAAVYVGFIVFNNLSIQINPLGAHAGAAWAHAAAQGCAGERRGRRMRAGAAHAGRAAARMRGGPHASARAAGPSRAAAVRLTCCNPAAPRAPQASTSSASCRSRPWWW